MKKLYRVTYLRRKKEDIYVFCRRNNRHQMQMYPSRHLISQLSLTASPRGEAIFGSHRFCDASSMPSGGRYFMLPQAVFHADRRSVFHFKREEFATMYAVVTFMKGTVFLSHGGSSKRRNNKHWDKRTVPDKPDFQGE